MKTRGTAARLAQCARAVSLRGLAGLTLLILWALASAVAHAAPLAGSRLENTARATYFDTDKGFNAALQSNTVSITVQALEALTLTSDNALQRAAGGIASLPHRLTNTGNATSTYVLRFANRTDDDHDLQGLRLVWDRNGNGVADAGEPQIDNGATFGPLASGEFADFVLIGSIAEGAPDGRVARIDLGARSVAQGATGANIDSVTVAEGALLQLLASASNASPKVGETVTLMLTASNTGNRAASGLPVSVDGVPLTMVLMRDVIPANTTFVAPGAAGAALVLYHLQGQPENSYSRSAPADLRQVDALAFGFAADIAPGQSLARSLDVQINPNAAGPVTNVGRLLFMDGVRAQPIGINSNPVRMVVPDQPPRLRLFADPQYTRPITVLAAGQPFHVGFTASRCNLDPLRAETQMITVSSSLAGDSESFIATETGPNSGEFRIEPFVPTVDALHSPLVRGDGRLSVRPNDQLTVSVSGCGATQMQATLLVDPFGVAFDSKTSAPVAGAVVTLLDITGAGNGGHPGALARVFLADGLTPAPSVLTTGADGEYRFPLVAPSVYRVQVVAPSPYTYPSTLAASLLPPERVVDAGSYGSTFTITELSEPVHLDIPLDADPRAGFFIEKTALRKTVELGEFVDYQVKVKNVTGQLLGRIRVTDQLPAGFAYLRGSARLLDASGATTRLDHSALPEPEGGVGPALVFNVGSVDDGALLTLSYRVRVGPGALQGDGINRAQATSAGPLAKLSNESRAAVQVLPGVFGNRGFLVGSVYADCNANRERDADEPGITGVRLFLEDGTFVTTDRLGRYSLYGLKPQTHVLKLDRTSLPFSVGPEGEARLALLANRNAGDAGSRFIDMKNGEMQRADFAVTGCSDTVRSAIAARAESVAHADENAETIRATRLAADPRIAPVADAKALPASGVVGAGKLAAAANAPSSLPPSLPSSLPSSAPAPTPLATAGAPAAKPAALPTLSDEAIGALDNSPAILSPIDAQVLGYAQTTVTLKGALGAMLNLRVNGVLLPATRIGRVRTVESQALQVVEYVGIDLKPGSNALELMQLPVAGAAASAPARFAISVAAPGVLAQLRLSAPTTVGAADGRSMVRVTIEPLDAAGLPVTSPTPVTLNASRGRWQLRDLDPDEPGVQVFVEGGRLVAELESPSEPGDVLVQAASGNTRAQVKLGFNAELRPLIAAGIVEGVFNLRNLNRSAVQPARAQDGFEQALKNVAGSLDGGHSDTGARAALFLKGKVLGDTLLTLAYDSDKDQRDRLFRDIQPGEFYPVYGDNSVKGFDAQSTGRLYVRLDRGRSYVLYGDFNTQTEAPLNAKTGSDLSGVGGVGGAAGRSAVALEERRLGQYDRSLNGLRAHLESDDGRRSVSAFASQTSSRQVVDELPALGTSGPYALSRAPLVENSEKIELLTRDRSQSALIVRSVALARFADYEVETLTGRILLKAPFASLDAGFNPNSLRVTYEVEQGGAQSWVGGVSARVEASEQIVLGAGVVRDSDPQHPLTLQSVGARLRPAPGVVIAAEVARSETPLGAAGGVVGGAVVGSSIGAPAGGAAPANAPTSGMAARIELRHESDGLQVQAQIVRASVGFENPSASITKGRQEITAKATYKAGDNTTLKAEVLRSEDLATAARRSGAQLAVEYAVNQSVRAELALRHSGGAELGAPVPGVAAAAGGVAGTPAVPVAATTVLAKLTAQVPGVPRASVFAEVEQEVENTDRHVAAVGGEYRLDAATRLYGRYEFISSLGSRYGLNDAQQRNATVFGVQTEYMVDANLFSEYRLRDALDGRQAEAAVGLRNRWKLGGGWSVSTGYERVHSLNAANGANAANGVNVGNGESTAVTGGVEYTGASDWKGATRLELRDSTASSSLLGTVGIAFKASDEWTALGRNLLTITRQHSAASKTEDWLQFGMAYRENAREGAANKTNALMRAEYRTEDITDPAVGDSGRRVAIISAHVNHQGNPQLQLSARLAAKWARDRSLGLDSRETTQLLSARATYDIAPRWDLGAQAAALIGASGRARQLGLGAEAGYLLADNLWASLGWNLFGFTDRDLTAQDSTQRGFYIRLRAKFDEALF